MRFKPFYLVEEDMPTFVMTVGIPGSGKSTWLKKQSRFKIVSPDSIRKQVTGDISNVSQDARVWTIAKKRVTDLLKKGSNVVLDATNVDSGRRTDFLKGLPKAKLKAKIFKVDPKEAKARIKKDIKSVKIEAMSLQKLSMICTRNSKMVWPI